MEFREKHTNILELYWLENQVKVWNKLSIWKWEITVPSSYLQTEESLWMIYLLLWVSKLDTKELDNYENKLLSPNELEQLKTLFQFLEVYRNSKESFFDKTNSYIEKVFDKISERIPKTSSLWAFVKEKLSYKNSSSFLDLVEEYIQFTQSYLEENNWWDLVVGEEENEDDYYEHDWVSLEKINGDAEVLWVINPYLPGRHFSRKFFSSFNHKTWKFSRPRPSETELQKLNTNKKTFDYRCAWKKGRRYELFLDIHNLQISDWNEEEVRVFKKSDWNIFLHFLKNWQTTLKIIQKKQVFQERAERDSEIIYTWTKIDTSQFQTPQDIKNYIQSTKKYNTLVAQDQFNTGNTNKDLERLFEAPECDCLPANKLFIILCRNIWFPSRLVRWVSAYGTKNKKTKETKTIISGNRWHAWSEVFLDGKWVVFDATPFKQDENEQNNEEVDILENLEEVIEQASEEQNWKWDSLEIKKETDKTIEEVLETLDISIENPYFYDAYNFVKDDAKDIIEYIKKVLKDRKNREKQKSFKSQKVRKKRNRASWKVEINPKTIENLATGSINIFTKRLKPEEVKKEDIDTTLEDISLAIDISGSMGAMTWNWEAWQKSDYAYLCLVLLYLVAKWLGINFKKVVLFWDNVYEWTTEEILESFEVKKEANDANSLWIQSSLDSIKSSKKWLCIIISDWDWQKWQAFFNDESREILNNNKNLYTIWYGFWSDASQKLVGNIKDWKVPTVIDFRMQEAKNEKQVKWYPLEVYSNTVGQLKRNLVNLMTQKNVEL